MSVDATSTRDGVQMGFAEDFVRFNNDNYIQPYDDAKVLNGVTFSQFESGNFYQIINEFASASGEIPIYIESTYDPSDPNGNYYKNIRSTLTPPDITISATPYVTPPPPPPLNCWSHPGSYFGLLSFMTRNGDQIMIQAGNGQQGFHQIIINNQTIISSSATSSPTTSLSSTTNDKKENADVQFPIIITGHAAANANNKINAQHCSQPFTMIISDRHHLSLNYSIWSMTIDNSDMFLNLASVRVSSWSTLINKIQSHGLLGQTWKVLKGNDRGEQVSEIVGLVDDYLEGNNEIYGTQTLYNKFNNK